MLPYPIARPVRSTVRRAPAHRRQREAEHPTPGLWTRRASESFSQAISPRSDRRCGVLGDGLSGQSPTSLAGTRALCFASGVITPCRYVARPVLFT